MALVLRSGSLPITLQTEEVRARVGPSLGQDSINAGARGRPSLGGAAVVVTILLYYGPLFGGVLTVGLAYIMALVFGILSGLGAGAHAARPGGFGSHHRRGGGRQRDFV